MRKGVTFIELLIAISILIILAAIFALIFINNPAAKARDAGRLSDSDRLRKNLEFYRSENDKYPETDPDHWKKLEEDADAQGPFYQAMITYLKNVPTDPLLGKQSKNNQDYAFYYKTAANGTCYKIHIEMEKRDPYEISGGTCATSIAFDIPPSGGGGGASPSPGAGGEEGSPSPSPSPDDGGGGASPSPSGGGEDQVQRCINNSPAAHLGWILAGDIAYVDKAVVSRLANDCSGLLLTIILSGDILYDEYGDPYNDGCGVGADPELGRASATIPNNGDNNNKTMVDFVPDAWIPPIECADVDIS